jgi:hypothetical protein
MSRYEGLKGQPDKIKNGGSWIAEHGSGGEVCNFAIAQDGYVYGYVETLKRDKDRKIRIEAIGGTGASVTGVDVIWTATDPIGGGRKVVGWYRNATVFRERQPFKRAPSPQHRRDKLASYRMRALRDDVTRLELGARDELRLGRGAGWMGHTPWWTPSDESAPEIRAFVEAVRRRIDLGSKGDRAANGARVGERNSASAPVDPYTRYVQSYEMQISPRHHELQTRFERFLETGHGHELQPNSARVDIRFRRGDNRLVLAEIKPCDATNIRYAIRTAIGQLLDYQQSTRESTSLLIVLDRKPDRQNTLLATENGFGVAYPTGPTFDILWPR